jgi:hypothetical protein
MAIVLLSHGMRSSVHQICNVPGNNASSDDDRELSINKCNSSLVISSHVQLMGTHNPNITKLPIYCCREGGKCIGYSPKNKKHKKEDKVNIPVILSLVGLPSN